FFQAEDGIRDFHVTGVQTCALPISPKQRTLELFGTFDPDTGRYAPFHLYTMRQAIEEGFILDVLANYTTYQTFFRIGKAVTEDRSEERRVGKECRAAGAAGVADERR